MGILKNRGAVKWTPAPELKSKVATKIKNELLSPDFVIQAQNEDEAKSYAKDAVVEACRSVFVVDLGISQEEQLYNRAWLILKKWANGDDESYCYTEAEEENPIAENDREDAIHYIASLDFIGSEKQIKWAKSIALNAVDEIAIALKNNKKIPTSAKWWIENRGNISL
jgi:hypothetical protein